MEQVVDLVGHLVWPALVVAVLLLFWRQWLALAEALAERLADPDQRVRGKLGSFEFDLGPRVEALEADQKVTQEVIAQQTRQGTPATDSTAIPEPLQNLADEYLEISIADRRERTRVKNDLATQMGVFVLTHDVDKDLLAGRTNQGLLLALAEAVRIRPQSGDMDRLVGVSGRVDRLHVRYRIAMALGRLIERGFVAPSDRSSIEPMLDAFEAGADPPLRTRIEQTRVQLAHVPT